MTKPKRCRKRPMAVADMLPADDPIDRGNDARHAERAYRHMAERGSRNLLAAVARLAFREGVLLRGMTPEEQLEAAKADGWQGRVIGAARWAGGAVRPCLRRS